ncbi:MAG TPA: SH3-like domain-containing protein [Actinophytocola sp.]|uniref:SH3-like domain-containing protein n=1 Tax=Actinophytocola sp. TaxID=1872138 RepID=UPI002DDD0E27|nr:SH3-like domain-containing protein [Actinophytocola sp.]HEV2780060.1 SH3-like domain-containing protein [Actinophytocola sp.]
MTFEPGQPVRARLHGAPGHTRLPRYVRGRPGTIHALRGRFRLADALARGQAVDPEPLYSVRFAARELWGDDAGDHDVYLDLFESYLESHVSELASEPSTQGDRERHHRACEGMS